MKMLLCSLIVLLLTIQMAAAQETPTVSDWTTEQRCIIAPSQPPQGWTYDGVIFTFKWKDGIHARRADMATPYYVAFDSDAEFGVDGSFSPDGEWFAVPFGHKDYGNMSGSSWYVFEEIQVYSTTPAHTMYRIPVYQASMANDVFPAIALVNWLDSQHIATEFLIGANARNSSENFDLFKPTHILNPFSREATVMALPEHTEFVSASPDNNRWIFAQGTAFAIGNPPDFESAIAVPIEPMFNASVAPFLEWTADSSKFAAILSDGTGIGIFDRDGNILDAIPSDHYARLSFARDGKRLAYVTRGGTIRIANFDTRTIIDTCISSDSDLEYRLAFSPDGSELAFPLPQAGYTYILDIAAWQAYRIDLAAADVVGWYPLE